MSSKDTLPAFITNVHALKSASASLGAADFSAEAARLEAAGKTEDMAFIREHLPVFTQHLVELVKNIRAVLTPSGGEKDIAADTNLKTDISAFILIFRELAEALKSKNASEIDRILEELNNKPLDAQTRETLEKISDEVLMTEFDNALNIINSIIPAQTK